MSHLLPRLSLTLALAAAGFFNSGILPVAQAQGEARPTVRVGIVTDRTGAFAEYSRDFFAGAKTWFDEANARRLLGSRRIEVVQRATTGTDANATLTAARAMLAEDRPALLFGLPGDAAVTALCTDAQLQKSGLPIVSPLAGIDAPAGCNVQFSRASYAQEFAGAIRQLRNMGVSRFALVTPADVAPALRDTLRQQLTQTAGSNVPLVVWPAGTASSARGAALNQVQASGAQAVFVLADSLEYGEIYNAVTERQPGTLVVGPSLVNPVTLSGLFPTPRLQGAVLSQAVPDPTRGSLAVVREFRQLFGKYFAEAPTHAALEGFIAARLVVERLRTGGDVPDALSRGTATKVIDVGGMSFDYTRFPTRGTEFADLAMMRKDGSLAQ
jgi:branched-chain amino acid transport system substrate-binding protein